MKVLVNLRCLPTKKYDPKITLKIVGTFWIGSTTSKFAIMWSKIRELFGVNSTEFFIEKSKIVKWLDAMNEFSSRNGSYH